MCCCCCCNGYASKFVSTTKDARQRQTPTVASTRHLGIFPLFFVREPLRFFGKRGRRGRGCRGANKIKRKISIISARKIYLQHTHTHAHGGGVGGAGATPTDRQQATSLFVQVLHLVVIVVVYFGRRPQSSSSLSWPLVQWKLPATAAACSRSVVCLSGCVSTCVADES